MQIVERQGAGKVKVARLQVWPCGELDEQCFSFAAGAFSSAAESPALRMYCVVSFARAPKRLLGLFLFEERTYYYSSCCLSCGYTVRSFEWCPNEWASTKMRTKSPCCSSCGVASSSCAAVSSSGGTSSGTSAARLHGASGIQC